MIAKTSITYIIRKRDGKNYFRVILHLKDIHLIRKANASDDETKI